MLQAAAAAGYDNLFVELLSSMGFRNDSTRRTSTTFNLRVFYRSKYGIVDSNNNQILDQYDAFVKAYFLTNLSITKTFKHKLSVQIGSNNLFNFKNPNQISTLSGRQLFARMQFNL